jgi:hypothetical protein
MYLLYSQQYAYGKDIAVIFIHEDVPAKIPRSNQQATELRI